MSLSAGPTPTPTTQAPLSDDEVVRRVVAGETALYEVLVRRHDQRVYRTVRSVLRDEDEVEDAMQQAWLTAYLHLADFAFEAAFSTWLVRIAMNEALGRLRRRARVVRLGDQGLDGDGELEMATEEQGPEERAAGRELAGLLEQAVDALAPAYRSVYMLREVEQLSTAETGAALRLSDEAVKVRLHRARAMLRERLADEVGRAAPEAFAYLAPRCNRMVERVMAAIAALRPTPPGAA